jgi:hypothetical protein
VNQRLFQAGFIGWLIVAQVHIEQAGELYRLINSIPGGLFIVYLETGVQKGCRITPAPVMCL